MKFQPPKLWTAAPCCGLLLFALAMVCGQAHAARSVGSFSGEMQLITSKGKCADVTNYGTTNGALIQVWDCGRDAAQSFNVVGMPDGSYKQLR